MSTKYSERTRRLVLGGLFCAIVIVMTVVPYTGYISYSPLNIEITTLHIPVILGAVFLGWKYGLLLGSVWGITCWVRAFLIPTPANIPFQNPVITVLPRILVGLVAAAVFALFLKLLKNMKKRPADAVSALIAGIAGTLTNTVLVLSLYAAFGNLGNAAFADVVKFIIGIIVGVNGLIELALALIIVPLLYTVLSHVREK